MSVVLTRPRVSNTGRETRPIIAAEANEFMVFCPGCGTFETVWLGEDGLIVPTRKFFQEGSRVYHNCGSGQPCRFYHGW